MKTKTFAILFALAMVLSMAVGVYAQDFTETWDENTVLTVFNDLDMYFPDMFADVDSDFLWVDNGPKDYPSEFETKAVAKAPIKDNAEFATATFDPCGDGLIKYDLVIEKEAEDDYTGSYYGDSNTTHIRDINATLTVTETGTSYSLGIKKCESTGGDGCHSVTFKKTKNDAGETVYQGHLKGYLTVPYGVVLSEDDTLEMSIDFSTYMTALWPVEIEGPIATPATKLEATKKDYCQDSLYLYDAFKYSEYENNDLIGDTYATRAVYDENTGEARLQVVIANYKPMGDDLKKQNYVIPAEVFAFWKDWADEPNADPTQRITDYTCKFTVFNVANAAPRTDYCKFGEGIAIPNHGMVRIDITIDALSGDLLRAARGEDIPFYLRLGGMGFPVPGKFKAVEFPCPKVSRMQVMDPLKPFMTFYGLLSDGAIKPSGAYGVYEGGVWGMYQKCGKYAYMMVRLKNDGLDEEIVNLDHTAVAINGGTPMKWNWVMTTVEPEKGSKIILNGGDEVILLGRAKVTDIPSQLNADTAMTGAVNFTDFGFYITGKVFSDHNNTRCFAAPK